MARVHMDAAMEKIGDDFPITMWRDNRTDQEYELNASAVLAGFRSYAEGYDEAKRDYYGADNMLVEYMTGPEGLHSAVSWPWWWQAGRAQPHGKDDKASLTEEQWNRLSNAAHLLVWGR